MRGSCVNCVFSVSPVRVDGAQARCGAHAELCVRHESVSVCSWPGPQGVSRLSTCTPHGHVDSVGALNASCTGHTRDIHPRAGAWEEHRSRRGAAREPCQ